MKARITIICENSVSIKGGIGEHGFAAYLETERGNYLFDTGAGGGLIPNLLRFDKDPLAIQKVILSHGHHDHTSGLPFLLEISGEMEVLAHPDIFSAHYNVTVKDEKQIKKYVGMKYQRAYLESLGARFALDRHFREVTREMYITGEVPRKTPFEKVNPKLFVESGGTLIPDPILDDQSLLMDSPKGLVLILGCAHAGMINILEYVLEETGKDRIYAILGGTHLEFASLPQLEETLTALKKFKVERIGVCHCTGPTAAARLLAEFGERFFFGRVGETLEVS